MNGGTRYRSPFDTSGRTVVAVHVEALVGRSPLQILLKLAQAGVARVRRTRL